MWIILVKMGTDHEFTIGGGIIRDPKDMSYHKQLYQNLV